MSAAPTLRMRLRVRYAECDQQGIVFNSRYGEYADLFMSELVRAAFGSYRAMLDERLDMQVVRYLIEWTSGAKFDDVIEVSLSELAFGNTSVTTRLDFRRHPDGSPIARVELVNVLVNTREGAKTPIPESVRARLRAGLSGALVDFSGAPGPVRAAPSPLSSKENP